MRRRRTVIMIKLSPYVVYTHDDRINCLNLIPVLARFDDSNMLIIECATHFGTLVKIGVFFITMRDVTVTVRA